MSHEYGSDRIGWEQTSKLKTYEFAQEDLPLAEVVVGAFALIARLQRRDHVHLELGALDHLELEHRDQRLDRRVELAQREQQQRGHSLQQVRHQELAPPTAAAQQCPQLQDASHRVSIHLVWAHILVQYIKLTTA